jgi:peptidyl-dipeptidase Dcp
MIVKSLLLGATALACCAAAAPAQKEARANPFAAESTLPFHAPRFDLIRDSDYQPAIERGMAIQLKEMTAIADNPAAPTFDNTIAAMEKSGRMLERAELAFYGVVQANTNPTLDAVQTAEAPKLAQHSDAIYLNPKLFQRIKTLHDKADSLGLTAEQRQVLDLYYQQFVHAGAELSDADKAKLRTLNTDLSTLETAFQQKLLAAAKAGALVVDDKAKLAGLSDAEIAAAAEDAKGRQMPGKWVLPLQNTTQQPALASLTDRATREALFNQGWTRAEKGDGNDTRATIAELASLRAQKANLLGYPNYAAYVLYDQMAKTPDTAIRFMENLVPATAAEQKREAAEIQATIKADGGDFQLEPWDWEHYAEQVRKEKYDLDHDQVKHY